MAGDSVELSSRLGADPVLVAYRYLRLAIVASVVLLFAGVLVAITQVGVLRSISAYYYTSSRTVFVGAIFAGSMGLLAVRGRPGWENVLLNVAAMLLPLVPIIPTAIKPKYKPKTFPDFSCGDAAKCIPKSLGQAVGNGLLAYLAIVGIILLVAFLTWRKATSRNGPEGWGLILSTGIWTLVVIMYFLGENLGARESLLRHAHNVAAIGGFSSLCVVAAINAAHTNKQLMLLGKESSYKRWYQWVAGLMATFVVLTVIVAVLNSEALPLVFILEAALLVLFAVFWGLQTREYWYEGVPVEVWQDSIVSKPSPS